MKLEPNPKNAVLPATMQDVIDRLADNCSLSETRRRDLRSPRDVTRKGRAKDRSRRKREMAQLLAAGYGTGAAARLLGVSAPAVSIARSWLEASWRQFQGESNSLSDGHLPRR